jgi:hypothetical protein
MEVWGGSQLIARGVAFGGLDAWVYSKSHGNAQHGGVVYDASICATGRIARLLLADVAGHGLSVASTAADLRTLMRRFVNRLDQTEFVRLYSEVGNSSYYQCVNDNGFYRANNQPAPFQQNDFVVTVNSSLYSFHALYSSLANPFQRELNGLWKNHSTVGDGCVAAGGCAGSGVIRGFK